jgi:hypothetical protein
MICSLRWTRLLGRQLLQHLARVGEAAFLLLRVDQLTVGADLEDAALAFDERRVDALRVLEFGRQTGGPGQVTSLHAVGDLDGGHGLLVGIGWKPVATISAGASCRKPEEPAFRHFVAASKMRCHFEPVVDRRVV